MRDGRALLPLAAVPALGALLCGCGEEIGMDRQAKLRPQAPAPIFASGGEFQPPPPGTAPLGALAREAQDRQPPPVTLALVQRGRERHAVACAPCHGDTGAGDGRIVARGYPAPPDYRAPEVAALDAPRLFDVITNGYGVMYGQAERVAPADRWAIIAYIRALQAAPRPGVQPAALPAPGGRP